MATLVETLAWVQKLDPTAVKRSWIWNEGSSSDVTVTNSPAAWQSKRRRSNEERWGSPKIPDRRPGGWVGRGVGLAVGLRVGGPSQSIHALLSVIKRMRGSHEGRYPPRRELCGMSQFGIRHNLPWQQLPI